MVFVSKNFFVEYVRIELTCRWASIHRSFCLFLYRCELLYPIYSKTSYISILGDTGLVTNICPAVPGRVALENSYSNPPLSEKAKKITFDAFGGNLTCILGSYQCSNLFSQRNPLTLFFAKVISFRSPGVIDSFRAFLCPPIPILLL